MTGSFLLWTGGILQPDLPTNQANWEHWHPSNWECGHPCPRPARKCWTS